MGKLITDDTTLEDLMDNPEKYGAPSFSNYMKNRHIWFPKNEEEIFETVDKGSLIFKKGLKKFRFEIFGIRCKNLTEVERIMLEHGLSMSQLDFKPDFIPLGGGEAEMLIKFVSKDERIEREAKERLK
jgi:hypothetical protein